MADDSKHPDGLDDLDGLLHLEAQSHADGVAASHASSALAGHGHGRQLGWVTGSSLSAELSFYHGAACAITALSQTHPSMVPSKAVATARRLEAACQKVSLHRVGNHDAVDMEAHADELRALFRAAVTQAGLIVRYDRVPSTMADLSF